MQDKGLDRRFRIIDDGDMQETVIETPHAFREEISTTDEPEDRAMKREELKAELDKIKGLEYNPRTSTDKLYQLYIENK